VGLLLGLALAAKWVGIYAIGGIVLLVLLRSALGRIAALLAMIAMTGVWVVAASSPGSGSPDALARRRGAPHGRDRHRPAAWAPGR
jgi:hypothetical protein